MRIEGEIGRTIGGVPLIDLFIKQDSGEGSPHVIMYDREVRELIKKLTDLIDGEDHFSSFLLEVE